MLTPATRPWAAVCLVAVGITAAAVARPLRYSVEGLSMAPGLLPGDVVVTESFPGVTLGREPRRFERWVLRAPDGTAAIKRVAGLPGELVSIREGDLSIDGRRIVVPPPILAETASVVPAVAPTAADAPDRPRRHAVAPGVVFDDAAFAPTERRLLLPVRDVGLAAVVRMRDRSPTQSLRARVGGCTVGWRPPSAGRFAVVAGRLDGHVVAACWRCPEGGGAAAGRSCLPAGLPAAWQVERPWPETSPTDAATDADAAPPLAVWIESPPPGHNEPTSDDHAGDIEAFIVWRDVLHRPAADGREEWRLGPDEHFLLGDFPSGSRDSRHWGPLRRRALSAAVSAAH
jgi:type IV secretory pathway protease TraF